MRPPVTSPVISTPPIMVKFEPVMFALVRIAWARFAPEPDSIRLERSAPVRSQYEKSWGLLVMVAPGSQLFVSQSAFITVHVVAPVPSQDVVAPVRQRPHVRDPCVFVQA